MSTVEGQLYDHFNSNVPGGLNISWMSQNVRFAPESTSTYVLPYIELLTSVAREIPHNSTNSMVAEDYIFSLNLLVPLDSGTQVARGHVDSFRTLYHKKTINTTDHQYHFDVMVSRPGSPSDDFPEHFEIPVAANFRLYRT